jgi:hypothetical protein
MNGSGRFVLPDAAGLVSAPGGKRINPLLAGAEGRWRAGGAGRKRTGERLEISGLGELVFDDWMARRLGKAWNRNGHLRRRDWVRDLPPECSWMEKEWWSWVVGRVVENCGRQESRGGDGRRTAKACLFVAQKLSLLAAARPA